MGLMERLTEIAKELPDHDLAEVVGFAAAMKSRLGGTSISTPDKTIDLELIRAVRARCAGGFKWRREDIYDRGLR